MGAPASNRDHAAARPGMSACRRHLARISTATKRKNPAAAVNTSRKLKFLLHGLSSCSQEPFQGLRDDLLCSETFPRLTGAQKRPEGILQDGCASGQATAPPASCARKTYRKNRVTKVQGNLSIGSQCQIQDAPARSEDSDRLNTSFVERMNLAIPQGSAYLQRRSPAHARSQGCPAAQMQLLRCYYNFIRSHGGLRSGRETRTPAVQAGAVASKARTSGLDNARQALHNTRDRWDVWKLLPNGKCRIT